MAAINNPSGLPQPPLEISTAGIMELPREILQEEILNRLDPTDLLTARAVCKIFRREIDYLIRHEWEKTKQLPPNGAIPLPGMMEFLETNDPNADPLTLFIRLAKLFSDTYGIHIPQPTVPCSATGIANLQTIAKQIEDQSLITLWDQIRLQLNLPVPLQTADAIRAWMNDPANAGQLNSIITLRVVRRNLRIIPSEIRLLTQLRHLTLAYNKITAIPDAISALTQLQELDLTHNQITVIPDAIRALTQLQRLCLFGNQITAIPDAIRALTQLQELDLTRNQITVIPDAIRALTQLHVLNLTRNQITVIPDEIRALTQLRYLNLAHNKIAEIPNAIRSLTQIRHLNLADNQITEIPDALRASPFLWSV